MKLIKGFIPFLFLLTSCLDNAIVASQERLAVNAPAGSLAGTNKSYVYLDNPAIIDNENPKTNSFNIGNSLNAVPKYISDKQTLSKDCTFVQLLTLSGTTTPTTLQNCLQVFTSDTANQIPVARENDSWVFSSGSDKFHAVNTYYHASLAIDRFIEALEFTQEHVHLRGTQKIPGVSPINPVLNKNFWLPERSSIEPASLKLFATAEVDSAATAFYPAKNAIYFGRDERNPNFKMAQDPSIIYHEMAHAFVKIMLNQRNTNALSGHEALSSDLGIANYDEALAINEGIADFFSYVMNGRTRFSEWGAARYNASRPISESDSLHIKYVSESSQGRLSYPDFLKYDPNDVDNNLEDVHYAGQIVSHYLVALTKNLVSQCTFSNSSEKQRTATNYVMLLLSETLAELGDLKSTLTDFNVSPNTYFSNLHPTGSYAWANLVRLPDFRRFFQTLSKNINYHISDNLCAAFDQDDSERLLDDYGLLLFKNYNDLGNGQKLNTLSSNFEDYTFDDLNSDFYGGSKNYNDTLTLTNELNRQKTVLISKDLLSLPSTDSSKPLAYIFDGAEINDYLTNLIFKGVNVLTTNGIAGPEYNNDNLEISPGEVVGLSLNIFNNSNSTMAGVKLLANDWDHTRLADMSIPTSGSIVPCIMQNWPLSSEGGVTDNSGTPIQGECKYYDRITAPFIPDSMTAEYPLESPQPTCLVEYRASNETRWISQNDMRKSLSISDSKCLNNPSLSGSFFNGNECLIRFLPGANMSYFGAIDSGKTWAETIQGENNQEVIFHAGSVMLMEVNKFLPPGTKFNCRIRANFSNCKDCFDDPNNTSLGDHKDYQYSGDEPYKVINFQFRIGN